MTSGQETRFAAVAGSYPPRAGVRRSAILAALAACLLLGACVTETSHSVYGKEYAPEEAVKSRVDAAMEYLRKGDSDNALRHLRVAYEIDSQSAAVNHALALTHQMIGENALAEKQFRAALRADSSLTAARNNYAVFLYSQSRFNEARRELRRVTEDTLYTGRAAAFFNLGQCELRLEDTAAATAAFEKVLLLDRGHGGAMLELAQMGLAAGDFTGAQKYYQSYTMLHTQSARSLYMGIQLARQFGEDDKLASYALALKNLHPHSVEYQRYRQESSYVTEK